MTVYRGIVERDGKQVVVDLVGLACSSCSTPIVQTRGSGGIKIFCNDRCRVDNYNETRYQEYHRAKENR